MALSDYEQKQAQRLQEHRTRVLARKQRKVVPKALTDQARRVGARAKELPGAEEVSASAEAALSKVGEGLGKAMTRSSQLTISGDRITRAFAKRGHAVKSLEDIGELDLRDVHQVASFKRMINGYAAAAAVEGAAVGVAITGSQAAVAVSGGVAAAPSTGVVLSAVAGDAAAILVASSRLVGHIGALHGYDPNDPAEEMFMLSVLSLGAADTQVAKMAGMQQVSMLTKQLVRGRTWTELNKNVVTQVMKAFAAPFGEKITKRKLGQLVPGAGIAVGAGLNYKMFSDVGDAAYWAYMERFLTDKGFQGAVASPASGLPVDEDSDVIDVVGMLAEEGVDLSR